MAISPQVAVAEAEGPQRDLVMLTGTPQKILPCVSLHGSESSGFGWDKAAPFLWDFLPSGTGNLTRNPVLMGFPARERNC